MRRVSRRRPLRLLASAAGSALWLGCREVVVSSPLPQAADVRLQANLQRVEQLLRVEYSLENRSGGAIGVYDGAAGKPGSEDGWPDLTGSIYVSMETRYRVALKRVLAPLPQGVDIDTIELPAATRLQPGEMRSFQFEMPLPLVELSEYFPAHDGARWDEVDVNTVKLTLGYCRALADAVFQPRAKNPKLFKLASGFGPQEYASAEQDLIVPVRVRLDKPFERV
ncbi:MAG: hypothetical protein GC160_30255 [Acidobacteria bacterium]|nr:hypothetical protein [Acidobacteriota bacterium]